MNSFKDHYSKFRKDGTSVNRRHMRDTVGVSNATNPDMKHAGDVVPVVHRTDNNAVQPFEELKRVNSGIKHITSAHVRKLADQFGFNIPAQANEEVKCGNTGISVTKHPTKEGFYILQK